jgi:16S rRNA processing protein RimM
VNAGPEFRMSKPPRNPVLMAVIGAPHGIKGEVRVKSFTGDPLALAEYGPLFAADGRSFAITDIRPAKEVVVVRFDGVLDRGAAEALNGTELFVDRSRLPDDVDEDEFYHADLVGLSVRDDQDNTIGTVKAVQNFGGGDILVIALEGRGEAMIPFTRAAVPVVDIAARALKIDPVAAGLADNEDAEEVPGEPVRPSRGRAGFDPKRRPRGPSDAGGNR